MSLGVEFFVDNEQRVKLISTRCKADRMLGAFMGFCVLLVLAGCGRSAEEKLREADRLFQQAIRLHDQGACRESKKLFRAALDLDEDLDRRGRMGEELYFLGLIEISCGRYDDGLRFYTKALEQYHRSADRKNEVAMLNRLARISVDLDNNAAARAYLEEALTISSLFDDPSSQALTQLNLARVLRKKGDFNRALELIEGSRSLYETFHDSLRLRISLGELGRTYLELGRHEEAAAAFTSALEYVGGNVRERILFLTRIGTARQRANDARGALRSLDEAYRLALSSSGHIDDQILVMGNVGHVYFERGAYENAREFYQGAVTAARKAGKKSAQGYLLLLLCDVERELLKRRRFVGSADNAQVYATQASQVWGFLHLRRGEAAAKYRLGLLAIDRGDEASAVGFFKEAIQLEEDNFVPQWDLPHDLLVDPAVFNDYLPWYDSLIETLLKLQRTEEALWYLERKLQHRFQLLWTEVGPRLRETQFTAELDSLRLLRRHIGLIEKALVVESARPVREQSAERLEELESRWSSQRGLFFQRANAFCSQSPNFEWLVSTSAASLPDIQSALPNGTGLMEFGIGENDVWTLLVTKKNLTAWRSRGVAKQIVRNVAQVREQVGNAEEDIAVESMLLRCYRTLFRPVEGSLKGLRHLIIVSPPEFEGFPFHACLRGRGKGPRAPIVDKIGIRYLPVAAALIYERSDAGALSEVYAVGNPTGAEWDVEYEFKDMRSFFPEISLIMGEKATLNRVLELRGDMLCLSSEFLYNARNPVSSSFKLASEQHQGTIVEESLGSLSSLGPFSLVVISNEEELAHGVNMAHPQLVLLGGSRYVVANLWPHDRRASKQFMELFYSAMLAGDSVPLAFQHAQVSLSRNKDFSTPRLWALFFLFGV